MSEKTKTSAGTKSRTTGAGGPRKTRESRVTEARAEEEMAPKPKKSSDQKSNPAGATVTSKNWESGLTEAPFEEEPWQACVSLVVGNGPGEEEDLIRCLSVAAQQPLRRLFSLLTWEGTLTQIHKLGNPKAKKADGLPPFHEVAESAKVLLDADQEVPCDLMAKVVKSLLLHIKRLDQERREAEEAEQAEQAQKDGVQPPTKDKPATKRGKDPPAAVGSSKEKTKLKRRGDVEPPDFIDDEPEDGPQHYVLLLGFYHPLLIAALDAVGVHVSCIIRLCSEDSGLKQEIKGGDQSLDLESHVELARKLDLFWSGLRPVLDSGAAESKLHDVVQLTHTVPSHSEETEMETGTRIYEGVANLLYGCLERRRQHRRYLESIRLFDVPTVGGVDPQQTEAVTMTTRSKKKPGCEESAADQETEQPPLSVDVDVRYYGNLLDRVPPESCSVALILHCMLEQVVISTERTSSSTDTPRRSDDQLTDFMSSNNRLGEKFGAEDTKQPLVVRHHDEKTQRLKDLEVAQGFDPAQVERSMDGLCPVYDLIQSGARRRNSAPCWNVIKQQWQHQRTDDLVSWQQVERLFHLSVFESMPLTTVDDQGVLETASGPLGTLEPVIPWDKPLSFARQQLIQQQGQAFVTEDAGNSRLFSGGTRCQLDLSDVQSCRLRSLSDWTYAEHHDAAVFPQVLQSAWERFRCLDKFTGSLNNILYVYCHNPMSPDRHSKESWEVSLHTDYLEHVADAVSDWTKEEELKREAMELRNISPAESPEDAVEVEEEEEEEEEEPVIRKESLKAWKLEQEQLKEEQEEKKKSKNAPKGKQQPKDVEVTEEVKSKPADNKKSKTVSSDEKTGAGTTSGPESTFDVEPPPEETFKGFTGYSTGGMLIRVSGRLQHLYPSDGGVVTVENISYLEGPSLVKVVVKKDGHRFCTHINHTRVDPSTRQTRDHETEESLGTRRVKQGSLTALFQNGVYLSYSFYGSTGERTVAPPETSTHGSTRPDLDPIPCETRLPEPRLASRVCEDRPALFRSLSLSLPNGLVLQFLREDARGVSSQQQGLLVRQCFPLHGTGQAGQLQDPSLSKELSRIITSSGAVIRRLRDEAIQVLFADGSVSFNPGVMEGGEDHEKERSPGARTDCWTTTTPSGAQIHTVGNTHERLPTKDLLVVKATDPITQEVMLTREDLVVLVQNSDGSQSVEHADGTRITTLYQDRPPNVPSHTKRRPESPGRKSTSDCDPSTNDDTWDNEVTSSEHEYSHSKCNNVREEVFENSRRSDATPKEKVVLVEKEGCATVVMFMERHTARVCLADGTVITGSSQGVYEVFPPNEGLLKIGGDGTCVYSSHVSQTSSPTGAPATNRPGTYTMSHRDGVACDVTDPDGNHFQVMENGNLSVKQNEEESEKETRPQQTHLPRLFLVHADGSATELLSCQTVEEELHRARSDPAVALLQEPLPDSPDEVGITILKPGHRSVWSQWLLGKRNPDITPPNLRNRSWHDFPRIEKKAPGPPFGSNMGRGLTLRQWPDGPAAQRQPMRSCPEVLVIRELHQHRPLSADIRHTVDTRLKEYIESLMKREQHLEDLKVREPRTEEESGLAKDLLSLVLSFAEEDVSLSSGRRTSADLIHVYKQEVGAPSAHSRVSEGSSAERSLTSGKKSKWAERLTQHRQEVSEDKILRAALRNKHVVPYFHPENVPLYENLLRHQSPDSSSVDLLAVVTSDSPESFMNSAPRPLTPTPSRCESLSAGSGVDLQRSPSYLLPQTPVSSALKSPRGLYKSVHTDVTGKARRTKVRLPASVISSKLRSVPNRQFLSVEEPVSRKCRTVSLTSPQFVIRGFELRPSSVDFGALQEGTSSAVIVRLKNVGVDTCRFHVKQPPPATGLRVSYRPGPVPAGLCVELRVQILAMAAVGAREEETGTHICHDIIIQTELEILYLPVTATILPLSCDSPVKIHTRANSRRGSGVHQASSSGHTGVPT